MSLYDETETRGTIEVDADVSVRLERDFEALCPEDTRHIDRYTAIIEYNPDGEVYELEAVANYLDDFGTHAQEEIAHRIYQHLLDQADPTELTVTVKGRHHSIETEVTVP